MSKYHINKEGIAGKCSAQTKCPFGGVSGLENHFSTQEEARNFYEKSQSDNLLKNNLEKIEVDLYFLNNLSRNGEIGTIRDYVDNRNKLDTEYEDENYNPSEYWALHPEDVSFERISKMPTINGIQLEDISNNYSFKGENERITVVVVKHGDKFFKSVGFDYYNTGDFEWKSWEEVQLEDILENTPKKEYVERTYILDSEEISDTLDKFEPEDFDGEYLSALIYKEELDEITLSNGKKFKNITYDHKWSESGDYSSVAVLQSDDGRVFYSIQYGEEIDDPWTDWQEGILEDLVQ